MSENRGHLSLYGKSPLLQLVIALLITFTIGMALFTVLLIAGILFSGQDLGNLSDNFLDVISMDNANLLRYMMISQDLALFIVPALLIRKMLLPEGQKSIGDSGLPSVNELAMVVVLAFCIFPVTGITGQLNAELKLPDWLSGVEQWMLAKEGEASGLIELLIPSDTIGIMFLNLFIVAALTAFSEELVFRGVLQRIFYGFFKSPHPAIWVTAFLFSAVHLQFYGFIPRFILGLVFGYLYYWGGTLWLPMLAHFINNAVPVISAYFKGFEAVSSGPDISMWKQLLILPVPVVLIFIILIYFRTKYNSSNNLNSESVI